MRTVCTVCQRDVGVVPNWNMRQGQQADEYRVTRHRANERKLKGGPQEICPGSGVRMAVTS